ncbi:hypothetical protein, partial [Vibrio aestuarianus]|uniref:hypothetical protein n=1 Tax=Vibrio aestuarianus TaxID=28171 RepID=UPI0021C33E0C
KQLRYASEATRYAANKEVAVNGSALVMCAAASNTSPTHFYKKTSIWGLIMLLTNIFSLTKGLLH